MRRHGNLFANIASMENLEMAYARAKKGKAWQNTVMRFDQDKEENLRGILLSLQDKTFTTSPYRVKMIHEPKTREIYILPFSPDRIVQHAVMNILEPIWDNLFIHDSYACRVGKGAHAGSRRVMGFVRQYRYCLKCDVSKFYPSVDHDVLFGIIKKKIKCRDTLWLLERIIYSAPGGKNVPIGNYTSQWFGNLYLNELDHLLKTEHKCGAYVRYCDDFVVFHDDKRHLHAMAAVVRNFVADELKMTLSKCSVFPVSQGVDFLGYRHFRKFILLRKTTAARVKRRLSRLPDMMARGLITKEQARSSLASTEGWLRWANTHHLVKSLRLEELKELCNA